MRITDLPAVIKQKLSAPQHLFRLLLLTYRWLTLLPVLYLFQTTGEGISGLLLMLALGVTLLVTVLEHWLDRKVLTNHFFLIFDLLFVAVLSTFSGVTHTPYALYLLNPFLASAFFFQLRGALLMLAGFTPGYLLILFAVNQIYPLTLEPGWLFAQLTAIWLMTLLFGSFSEQLKHLQQVQIQLTAAHNDLAQQHLALAASHEDLANQKATLAAAHHQLEVIHDMTLLLQGASEVASIQQRVLRTVTTELGFSQAVLGLVNPATQRLESWQIYPPNENLLSAFYPLPLTPDSGFMIEELLNRRGGWWLNQQPLVADELLNEWLGQTSWLMLPLLFQEQPVGILLVTVEVGPSSLSEDQLVVLTAVTSQAAVALGVIHRVQQLAVEQERNRIARDIHDTVAQSLFGTVFTLDACIKMLPDQVDEVRRELVELRDLAGQVHQQVRRSILNIWPSELTLDQFKLDLCKYLHHYSQSNEFQIDFTIGGDFDGLPPIIRRNLYRVAQEALVNVVKHAGVNSARISLYVEPHEVQLSIRDQGKGFEPKVALAREYDREKFGLRGIRERIQALGGECEILSQVDQGTQVLVRIPIGRNGHG